MERKNTLTFIVFIILIFEYDPIENILQLLIWQAHSLSLLDFVSDEARSNVLH